MKKINVLGIELDRWEYGSCVADWGKGDGWATLYSIQSKIPSKGHATECLLRAKKYYEEQGMKVRGSVALNERMSKLYKKVGIEEVK